MCVPQSMLECVSTELIGEQNAETEVEGSDGSGDEEDELQRRGNVSLYNLNFVLSQQK